MPVGDRVTTYNYPRVDGFLMTERPYGLGALWIILGLLYLAIGFGFSFIGVVYSGLIGTFGGILVLVGLVDFVLGIGCFMTWPWIWTAGVAFTALHLIIGIVSLLTTGFGALLLLFIPFIILYYLLQPHVKAYFKKA